MRIAIHNPFFNESVAETELSRRLCIATQNLGWEALEVGYSADINEYKPDFVLAMHHNTPKLTAYPTYGCMWNPPDFIESNDQYIKNILSYDAYLCSSPRITTWIKEKTFNTHKKHFITPFYATSYKTTYRMPNLDNLKLLYFGIHWDGFRFKDLFEALECESYLEVYGRSEKWEYLKHAYLGELPFDGFSILEHLNRAGVGLCLHLDEHYLSNTPSMRVFEIVASGAIAICEDHDFIRDVFNDSVFYINRELSVTEKVTAISKIMTQIKDDPKTAIKMSEKAHLIFSQSYALENFLQDIAFLHNNLTIDKFFPTFSDSSACLQPQERNEEDIFLERINELKNQEYVPTSHSLVVNPHQELENRPKGIQYTNKVQLIIRAGQRPIYFLRRALDSVVAQTYKKISIILVLYNSIDNIRALLQAYDSLLEINVIELNGLSKNRSASLWSGLNALTSKYFGILDDDDIIFPNHVCILVDLLETYNRYGVAYSGSIKTWELDREATNSDFKPIHENDNNKELSSLAFFQTFRMDSFLNMNNFITSNSFLARTILIDEICRKDPELDVLEDFFLLLCLANRTQFIFSYEATCNFFHRISQKDNSVFEDEKKWNLASNKIMKLLWNQDFHIQKNLDQIQKEEAQAQKNEAQINTLQNHLDELEERLKNANNTIIAMEGSKFWKIRQQWFRLKRKLGLSSS